MNKKRILNLVLVLVLVLVLAVILYLFKDNESIKNIIISVHFILILYLLYYIYDIDKYFVLYVLFKGRKKKHFYVISLIISILLFPFSLFAVLIEMPRYTYLSDKLCEKLSINDCKLINLKDGIIESYNEHNFENDKLYSIFILEMKNINKKKKYIIYKEDSKYILLKALSEIFTYKEHDNTTALNYLSLSYEATIYYNKEIKDLIKSYKNLTSEFKSAKSDDDKVKVMIKIKDFLSNTKMNNTRYNETVRNMRLSPKFGENNEMNNWHNYFKNETDKELVRVNNVLNEFNKHFQTSVLSTFNERNDFKDLVSKNIEENKNK